MGYLSSGAITVPVHNDEFDIEDLSFFFHFGSRMAKGRVTGCGSRLLEV
jgi:hypothetical protein